MERVLLISGRGGAWRSTPFGSSNLVRTMPLDARPELRYPFGMNRKPRYPDERPRKWPLGLEPGDIRTCLVNLPVGRRHESPAELDAIAQWIRTRDLLLKLVDDRDQQTLSG
jgi:hypothetical protein